MKGNDLPNTWIVAMLGDLCEILDSMRMPINAKERSKRILGKSVEQLYPYYGATGQVGVIDDYIFEGEHVLLGEDGAPFLEPFSAKAYLATGRFWVNNHAHILKSPISNRYLCYFLNHIGYSAHVTGTTRLKLTQGALKNIPVNVAPENEQHRIVAKIERLFSELDNGIDNLKTAKAQLRVYRRAVLKHAFEGKLTARWRKQNKDKLFNPEHVLKRIQQARQIARVPQINERKVAVATTKNSHQQSEKVAIPSTLNGALPIGPDDLAKLPTLPAEWAYVRLCEIAEIGSGMSVSKSRELVDPITVPYLRVANVQRGHLDLSKITAMKIERDQLSRLQLKKWDVLFNEGGDRDKLGRGWIWESQIDPCITQNHVFRASPYVPSISHAKFISHWGNTFGQNYFLDEGKQTTNLASINKSVLSNFPVPLVSIEEQEEIVREIDKKLTMAEQLEREVTAALERLQMLKSAILDNAFSGTLVGQDQNDEPASALLERIRREKLKSESETKKSRSMVAA